MKESHEHVCPASEEWGEGEEFVRPQEFYIMSDRHRGVKPTAEMSATGHGLPRHDVATPVC